MNLSDKFSDMLNLKMSSGHGLTERRTKYVKLKLPHQDEKDGVVRV